MSSIQTACLGLLAILLLLAALQDLRSMEIPNGFSLAIVAVFATFAAAGLVSGRLPPPTFASAVACAALVLAGGTGAFALGVLGGGDVKLLAAVSLFAGSTRLLDFLIITALAAGGLAIAILAGAPIGHTADRATASPRQRRHGDLPLGPAIAGGGLWVAVSLLLG